MFFGEGKEKAVSKGSGTIETDVQMNEVIYKELEGLRSQFKYFNDETDRKISAAKREMAKVDLFSQLKNLRTDLMTEINNNLDILTIHDKDLTTIKKQM